MLSREYPPETGWGGIGAYTKQFGAALAEAGHNVTVISLTKRDSSAGESSYMDGNVLVHRVPWSEPLEHWVLVLATLPNSHHLLKASVAMWNKFLQLHQAEPFDVVEAPDHLAEGIFVAATRLAPLVVRLHTPHFKLVADGYHNLSRDLDNEIVAALEHTAILQAALVSSPSRDLAQFIARSTGMSVDQIEIVRNPVDTKRFCPEGDQAKPAGLRPNNSGADPVVFFAGRLEARKGIKYLIEAVPKIVKEIPGAQFVILGADTNTGENSRSVRAALIEQLEASGHRASVIFLDHAPLTEMPNYYRMADLCVVPSLYDNAPYTVLEALASGKAVVTTTAGGTPEYVKANETGLTVPKEDSDALATAIIQLLQDPAKLKAYGAAARQTALKEYGLAPIVEQALKTYELARQRHSRAHALYRKAPEDLVQDLDSLLGHYHRRLHKFGEDLSLRYDRENGST